MGRWSCACTLPGCCHTAKEAAAVSCWYHLLCGTRLWYRHGRHCSSCVPPGMRPHATLQPRLCDVMWCIVAYIGILVISMVVLTLQGSSKDEQALGVYECLRNSHLCMTSSCLSPCTAEGLRIPPHIADVQPRHTELTKCSFPSRSRHLSQPFDAYSSES